MSRRLSKISGGINRMWIIFIVALSCGSPVLFSEANLIIMGAAENSGSSRSGNSTANSTTPETTTAITLGVGQCSHAGLFRCPDSGRCIPRTWLCDGDNDCGKGEDELNCSEKQCGKDEHKCVNNNKCIPNRWLCDAEDDCGDNSDEHQKLCANRRCAGDQFQCKNSSQCISDTWRCDGQLDCSDGTDELDCNAMTKCSATEFRCTNGRCIFLRWKCDSDDDCGDMSDEQNCTNHTCQSGYFLCDEDKKCIPDKWKCDGESDCIDHSDERNCGQVTNRYNGKNTTCNPRFEFQCTDGPCIHAAWKCDGDPDCPDASDEANCTTTVVCNAGTEFMCPTSGATPSRCIPKAFVCNGISDCVDSADEKGCFITAAPKPCEWGTEFDCGDSFCIPLAKVCNNVNDCPYKDGRYADESPAINCMARRKTDYCASSPCDQSAKCVQGPDRPLCVCPFGYRSPQIMDDSGKKFPCEDIDECLIRPKVCTQKCRNTPGSYQCSCHQGYMLMKDKKTCRALGETPKLWLSNRVMIREIDLISRRSTPLLTDLDSAVAMDYSRKKQLLFWSDVAKEIIYKCPVPTSRTENGTSATKQQTELIKTGLSTPDGMAVDWIHDLLYWTDTGYNTISVIDFNGKYRKTLFDRFLDEPRAIALDPRDALMFWTDWGNEPKIERASMDGTYRKSIISRVIQWPNGLAVDYLDRRIFWADAKLKMLSSCDYDGNNRVTVLNSWGSLRHPFSLAVFEEKVYWTDWDTEGIHVANKYNGQMSNGSVLLRGLFGPMTIRVYQELNQPPANDKCDGAGCEQLCLPSYVDHTRVKQKYNPVQTTNDDGSIGRVLVYVPYSCQCADGFALAQNGKNCIGKPAGATKTTVSNKTSKQQQQPSSSVTQHEAKTTSSAGVAVAIIVCMALVIACVGFLVWRRMMRNSRRPKRMNFENPVYRRTVVDDANGDGAGAIHYDHLRLSMDIDQYHPTMDPINSNRSSGNVGGGGSGVYQPTTITGSEPSMIGVGIVQNGKYSMTSPLTENEEGSDYA